VIIVKKILLFFLIIPVLFTLQSMNPIQPSDKDTVLETMKFDIPQLFQDMFQLEKIQDRYDYQKDALFLKFKVQRSPEYKDLQVPFFNNFNIAMFIALSSEVPYKAYVIMYFNELIKLNQCQPIDIKISLESIWQSDNQSDFRKNFINDCCQQMVMFVDFIACKGDEYLCMQCKKSLYHDDNSSKTFLIDDFYIAPGKGWLCKSCGNQQTISDDTLIHIAAMEIPHSLVMRINDQQLKARNNLRNEEYIDDFDIASAM
jgi:hypothetical protein